MSFPSEPQFLEISLQELVAISQYVVDQSKPGEHSPLSPVRINAQEGFLFVQLQGLRETRAFRREPMEEFKVEVIKVEEDADDMPF